MMGFASRPVPSKTNPLGAKGCGEAGCAGGSQPAVMNAPCDAPEVAHIDMPATPEVIRRMRNRQLCRRSGPCGLIGADGLQMWIARP